MHGDPVDEDTRVLARRPEQHLQLVAEDHHELYHLEGGEVLLPPDVLLVFRTHRSHHVVEVHHDVDERVQKSKERAVTTWRKLEPEPHGHGHDAVVYHMQRGHVLVFLPQHEEKRVHELRKLAKVVPPACIRHPHRHRAPGVVDQLTRKVILTPPAAHQILIEYPGTEYGLCEVIDD